MLGITEKRIITLMGVLIMPAACMVILSEWSYLSWMKEVPMPNGMGVPNLFGLLMVSGIYPSIALVVYWKLWRNL